MKKLLILLGLFLMTLPGGCQNIDQTFDSQILVKQGIKFGDGSIQNTAFTGQSTGVVTWESITNKPLTFAPAAHDHNALYKPLSYVPTWNEITGKPVLFSGNYNDLTNKPAEVDLQTAVSQLPVIIIPKLTTAQINALTASEGSFAYDVTLHVLKIYNGTVWKTLITNQ